VSGRALSAGVALLLVVGCTQPHEAADTPANDTAALNEAIAGDMTAIRLKAAEARIEQLERQVGARQATPEKLDLQLLTQRLEALEARVYAGTPAPAPTPRTTERPAPQPAASPTPTRFNPFGL
jgi:uncharacterized coiled-coil protein SlyX